MEAGVYRCAKDGTTRMETLVSRVLSILQMIWDTKSTTLCKLTGSTTMAITAQRIVGGLPVKIIVIIDDQGLLSEGSSQNNMVNILIDTFTKRQVNGVSKYQMAMELFSRNMD